jgi:regulator of RNase E activity RraA
MSTRARKLGSRGAVLHGYVRDTKAILNLNFPTFGFGSYGQDSAPRYKVVDFRIPVEIGSVRVRPGDILFGDIDGVLAVPAETETEIFTRALEKARRKAGSQGHRGGKHRRAGIRKVRNHVNTIWIAAP